MKYRLYIILALITATNGFAQTAGPNYNFNFYNGKNNKVPNTIITPSQTASVTPATSTNSAPYSQASLTTDKIKKSEYTGFGLIFDYSESFLKGDNNPDFDPESSDKLTRYSLGIDIPLGRTGLFLTPKYVMEELDLDSTSNHGTVHGGALGLKFSSPADGWGWEFGALSSYTTGKLRGEMRIRNFSYEGLVGGKYNFDRLSIGAQVMAGRIHSLRSGPYFGWDGEYRFDQENKVNGNYTSGKLVLGFMI